MPTPISRGRRGERDGQRITRWAMIAVGLIVWVVALALPGYDLPLLLFSGAVVAWATFGLLTEP